MASPPGPRLFGIPATRAPVVAVIRRGPSDWCQLGRWDLDRERYEPGAWIRGTIYPQKCDLSPDGRWFAASILEPNADWPAGNVYEAVSRLPWLTALAAWNAGTTYTRGMHFADVPGNSVLGDPDVGDAAPILNAYRLDLTPPVQFAVERRRGWVEPAGTSPRENGGSWDERRTVTMEKQQPGGGAHTLLVTGGYAGHRTMPDWYGPAEYAVTDGKELEMLDGVQWADWDRRGRLLVATASGRLQIRDGGAWAVAFDEDLAALRPDPHPQPPWAAEC